jgi:hypothetical protein
MSKIRVSELSYSLQGEGRFVGVPSIILKTFGCNFTCGSFGLPRGVLSQERFAVSDRNKVNPFNIFSDLPAVTTGCDSYSSWMKDFEHLSPLLETNAIVDRIMELLPFNDWKNEHLVITGGEPLLGWQDSYPDLLEHKNMQKLKELTFETNGTQALSNNLKACLKTWNQARFPHAEGEITFSVSPKLSNSGEPRKHAIQPDIVAEYEDYGYTYLKFVVANQVDVDEALEVTRIYRSVGFQGPVYLMPVGGVESVYAMNNRRVAELAMKHGLRYSNRHQHLSWSLKGN